MTTTKTNGNLKYLTLGTLLALVAGAVSYGVFYGTVNADVRHNSDAIKIQVERCDETNAEFRRKFEIVQQKTLERYEKINTKIDDISRRIN